MSSFSSIALVQKTRTRGAMTIPVDFNDVGAATIPTGTIFRSQADVDTALGAAVNFKFFSRVFDALPQEIAHVVTVNVAGGIQYADPAELDSLAFVIGTTTRPFSTLSGGAIIIQGDAPANYSQVVSPLIVLSVDDGAVSSDPRITFSGTPFTGLNLKGLFAVASNGFVGIISDNDNSSIGLNVQITPALTPGVTTVFMGRPNTELRNALSTTPTNRFKTSGGLRINVSALGFGPNFEQGVEVRDININSMFGTWGSLSSSPTDQLSATFTRCLIDFVYQDSITATASNGRGWQASSGSLGLITCAMKATSVQSGTDEPIFISSGAFVALIDSYIGEWSEDPIIASGDNTIFLQRTVIDGIGNVNPSIQATRSVVQADNSGHPTAFSKGRYNTIRNAPAAGGILMQQNSRWGRTTFSILNFEDCVGPCVVLRDTSQFLLDVRETQTGPHGIIGSGNLDVAFEVETGGGNYLALDSDTTATGANGDIRFSDGVIRPYDDVTNFGPLIDGTGNRVERK